MIPITVSKRIRKTGIVTVVAMNLNMCMLVPKAPAIVAMPLLQAALSRMGW